MNKIKQILIGAGMIALSGNAAAIIENKDGSKVFSDYSRDLIMEAIAGKYSELSEAVVSKLGRKMGKIIRKEDILGDGVYKGKALRSGKIARLDQKIARKKLRVAEYLAGLEGGDALLANNVECDALECTDFDVPEPSTIALLGLGLIGIGAARRLRKKAR